MIPETENPQEVKRVSLRDMLRHVGKDSRCVYLWERIKVVRVRCLTLDFHKKRRKYSLRELLGLSIIDS